MNLQRIIGLGTDESYFRGTVNRIARTAKLGSGIFYDNNNINKLLIDELLILADNYVIKFAFRSVWDIRIAVNCIMKDISS
jgi:hypothetical protein